MADAPTELDLCSNCQQPFEKGTGDIAYGMEYGLQGITITGVTVAVCACGREEIRFGNLREVDREICMRLVAMAGAGRRLTAGEASFVCDFACNHLEGWHYFAGEQAVA